MADLAARMRQLIGTTADWAAHPLVIGDGELAFERMDDASVKMKIGNGVDTYDLLPYSGASFGAAYTWRDVTSTYTLNVNHTSPNHPIMINVRGDFVSNGGIFSITSGGIQLAVAGNGGNGQMIATLSAIIPPGSIYRVDQSAMDQIHVYELRAD